MIEWIANGTLSDIEQRIVHACGHEQVHVIYGFDAQVARKARWLRSTQCRTCFIADKQAEQAKEAARNEAAIAHLDLPELAGSGRQIEWATTIRASRLAALTLDPFRTADADCALCLQISDAKWWIDHRALPAGEFIDKARAACTTVDVMPTMSDRVQSA
ncbi:hypothetical protein [Sphingomonas sp. Leaf4]|uniref:hypothetical protein n=1 Tax=Sphingomonas sp. Leaf4 TaxID=2876553 RepID=UPI001E36DD1A|nr:hypothetical protein [Sphingomonas sp. Leaf4]